MNTKPADPVPGILIAVGVVLTLIVFFVFVSERNGAAKSTVAVSAPKRAPATIPAQAAPVSPSVPLNELPYQAFSSPLALRTGSGKPIQLTFPELRDGPDRQYKRLANLPTGESVIGYGKVIGLDGSEWIHISRASGSEGFVLQSQLHDAPSAPRSDTKQVTSPEVAGIRSGGGGTQGRGQASIQVSSNPRREGSTTASPAGQDYGSNIKCVLPTGRIEKMSQQQCRQQSGVVYR